MWGIAIAGTWAGWNPRAMPVDRAGAATAAVLAAVFWNARSRMIADRDREALIKTLADAVPAQQEPKRSPTGPFPRAL